MNRQLTILQKEKLTACLVGCAVGDAIGLPFEGVKPEQVKKLLKHKNVRHCLLGRYGMWSDDTDHSIMLVQSILEQPTERGFINSFSWKLRFWLLTLPPGIGLGTARAIFKSFLGLKNAGVFSAGNGPCMRAASLGVIFSDDPVNLVEYNRLQTQLTHTDPKAQVGSRAIVEIAAHLQTTSLNIEDLENLITKETDTEWSTIVSKMLDMLNDGKTPNEFIASHITKPEKGVSGYVYHTVPAVIYSCMYHHFNFKDTMITLIKLGGDTDTCCAIAGSLCGVAHGVERIPELWRSKIKEFPVSLNRLNHITDQRLYRKRELPFRFLRNVFQLAVVLIHGFGRLLPIPIKKHFY